MGKETIFDRLSRFCREEEQEDFFIMAQETFWQDMVLCSGIEDFETLEALFGLLMSVNLTAFFASNDYEQHPDPAVERWNVVESFLAHHAGKVSAEDREFLQCLRQSHMSLYRIIGKEDSGVITMWDMLDKKNVTAQVWKGVDMNMNPGEIWGLRLLERHGGLCVMDAGLSIPSSSAKKLAADIQKLHTGCMKLIRDEIRDQRMTHITDEDIHHLSRVMWAPEICMAWMMDQLDRVAQNGAFHGGSGTPVH